MKKTVLLIIISIGSYYLSFAQITHTLQPIPGQRLQVSDLWQVTANNPTGDQRLMYLEAQIDLIDGTPVARYRTAPFLLNQGITRINPLNVQVIRQEYPMAEARQIYARTANFPEGEYRVCVRIKLEEDQTLVSEDCRDHQVVNPMQDDIGRPADQVSQHIRFSGNSYIEGFYASQTNPFQQIPRDYIRADINSTVSLSVLPFQFRAFYSTERTHYLQNMNALSLQFDEVQFKNNLRTLVTERVEEDEQLRQLTNIGELQKLAELESIERLSEDSGLQEEFEQLADMDQLNEDLSNMNITAIVDRANSIRQSTRQRAVELDYETRRTYIIKNIEVYESLSFEDSESEEDRLMIIDSLNILLVQLEQRRDSLDLVGQADIEELNQLEAQMQNYNRLKTRVEQMQEIAQKKEEFENLLSRKDELMSFKEQLINDGRLSDLQEFDYASLADPGVLRRKLNEYNLFTGERRLFFGVNELAVGTVYPYYSPLILNGIKIEGGNVMVNPGILQIGATAGVSRNEMFLGNELTGYRQQFVAGRLGIGRSYASNFQIMALRAVDDFDGFPETTALNQFTPRSNFVLGSSMRLQFFKQRFVIDGEVAVSNHTRDNTMQPLELNEPELEQIPDFLQPTLSSRYGLAYNVNATMHLFNRSTRLRASTRSIDPAYYSMGAPFLRTNLIRYAFLAEQRLFQNQVTASIDYRTDSNHDIWEGSPEVSLEAISTNLQLRFRRLPFLNIVFTRHDQKYASIENTIDALSVITGYNYGIKNLGLATSLTYNSSSNENPLAANFFAMNQYVLTQSAYFPFPLSSTISVYYMETEYQQVQSDMIGGDFSLSATLFRKMFTTLGINYHNAHFNDNRLGIFGEIQYPFLNYFSFRLRYDNNYYRHDFMAHHGRINEYMLRSSIQMNW